MDKSVDLGTVIYLTKKYFKFIFCTEIDNISSVKYFFCKWSLASL